MQSWCWTTGRLEFRVEFFEYGPDRPEAFNGTISIVGTDLEIAFSGLAEFWKAVGRIRGQHVMRRVVALSNSKMECISLKGESLSAASVESAND